MKNSTRPWRNRIASLVLSAAALGGLHATAQAAPTLSLTVLGQTSVAWGNHLAAPTLRVTLSDTRSCAGPFTPQAESLTLRVGVATFPQTPMSLTCSGGVFSGSANLPFDVLYAFGAHYVTVQYSGMLGTAVSAPVFITLRAEYNFITPGGPIFASLATTASNCTSRAASLQDREALEVSPPPPNLRMPFEHVAFVSSDCAFALAPRAGPHAQYAQLEIPIDIAPAAEIWVNDYGPTGTFRTWRRVLSPVIRGRQATFEIFGGGSGATRQAFITATATIAIPQPPSRTLDLQDLWWGGDEQSGWGLNVAKNGERIFATLFAYEPDGRPLWVVMPEGTWDPVHEVYWGDLYIPTGSPFTSYDAARFRMGEPVGKGSLSFPTIDTGRFDYVVRDLAGGKNLSRFVYAPRTPDVTPPYPGMWWGGPGQDGWGVSIQQQGEVVFATWYTYGADGTPTWYYMPAGRKTSGTSYGGDLYRTTGARWFGAHYQGSSTRPTRVGTMQLAFASGDAGTMTATVDGVTVTKPIARFPF